MSTLLSMVNDLRGLLREEEVGLISAGDVLTSECIRLLNRAARSVLHEREWTFDILQDGVASFMAPFGDTVGTVTNGSTDMLLRAGTQAQLTRMALQPCRVVVTDDTSFGNTSYRIASGLFVSALGGYIRIAAGNTFPGTSGSGTATWSVYSDEFVLPSTVRRVLSCRHEETPLPLEFVDRNLIFDSYEQRTYDRTQSRPDVVMVGGGGTTTYDSGSATEGTSGVLLRIWPPPSAALVIHYSYVRNHTAMSAATDTLPGVPETVVDIIVQKAFYFALMSNMQNDPERARGMRNDLEIDLARAYAAHRPDPNRRAIPVPFGSGGNTHPYRRWSSLTIPEP